MVTKDEIIAALPKLSAGERRQVAAMLKEASVSDRPAPEPEGGIQIHDDWLLAGIGRWLSDQGLVSHDFTSLKRREAYKQYREKLPAVMEFLEGKLKPTARQRPALAHCCARSLQGLLQRRKYFSVGAMLSQIDKIPEALDEAFPGYVVSGGFRFVLDMQEELR